jgi:hypothetical protein
MAIGRNLGQRHDPPGHHVLRQPLGEVRAQGRLVDVLLRPGLRHHVRHQRPSVPQHHHGVPDGGMAAQRRLDLAQLHPLPANLHLGVHPT